MESAAADIHAAAMEDYVPPHLTIAGLLNEMEFAHDRMGADNTNKQLLFRAAHVIVQQAQAIVALEQQLKPRIVLPG